MDFSLQTFINICTSLFLKTMDGIGSMNPKSAFLTGALSWLAIEISIRKLSNAIRVIIIIAILGSTSVAALHLF